MTGTKSAKKRTIDSINRKLQRGEAVVMTAARWRFLTPRDDEVWDFDVPERWDPQWVGLAKLDRKLEPSRPVGKVAAWTPYVLVAVLLVITRLGSLPFQSWLTAVTIPLTDLFHTPISHTSKPL